jgi:hypothetical protein
VKFLGRQLRLGVALASTGAPLLAPGTEVGTPDGPGVVDRIELALLTVGDHVELDVPHVYVKLAGSGNVVQVCLCALVLHVGAAQDVLRSEFDRLWPALPEEDLPTPLAAALLEATGRLTRSASGAASALQRYHDPAALLRSATTAAVLSAPSQQQIIERGEAAVLAVLKGKSHA